MHLSDAGTKCYRIFLSDLVSVLVSVLCFGFFS